MAAAGLPPPSDGLSALALETLGAPSSTDCCEYSGTWIVVPWQLAVHGLDIGADGCGNVDDDGCGHIDAVADGDGCNNVDVSCCVNIGVDGCSNIDADGCINIDVDGCIETGVVWTLDCSYARGTESVDS